MIRNTTKMKCLYPVKEKHQKHQIQSWLRHNLNSEIEDEDEIEKPLRDKGTEERKFRRR